MAVHPIFALILSGNLIEVVAFIQSDPGAVRSRKSDFYNFTPLHYSCYLNHEDITVALLKHGADVNSRDNRDWTPLHTASIMSHSDVVDLLLRHNANINARDNIGETPLHLACQTGDLNTVLTLMRYNITLIFSNSGYSPLHTAAMENHVTIVETLITQFGWDVNQVGCLYKMVDLQNQICIAGDFNKWTFCSDDSNWIHFIGGDGDTVESGS